MAILLPQRFAVPLTHGDAWSCPGSGGEQRNFKRPFAIAPPAPRRAPRSRPRRPKSSAPYTRMRLRWGKGPVSCQFCRHENPAGARFCNNCGAHLAAPTITPEPRSYTPRHLVEKILASQSALRGERKLVTVLFTDVVHSMELAERVDPEEWHRLLDRLFRILAGGVHRYEGTINQYTGDGIMALFGAPIAHEDHAQRACAAALDLARELGALAEDVRRESGLEFAVRIGLNSGEVVVGRIGDDLRMDYTAQGHVVGLAARVQQLAPPGGVTVTEQTARLAAGFFDFVARGEHTLKGASAPVRVFELRGPGQIRSRLESSRARGFSRFVGRERELALLERALRQTQSGRPTVVLVTAEPGAGKSRSTPSLCFAGSIFSERPIASRPLQDSILKSAAHDCSSHFSIWSGLGLGASSRCSGSRTCTGSTRRAMRRSRCSRSVFWPRSQPVAGSSCSRPRGQSIGPCGLHGSRVSRLRPSLSRTHGRCSLTGSDPTTCSRPCAPGSRPGRAATHSSSRR